MTHVKDPNQKGNNNNNDQNNNDQGTKQKNEQDNRNEKDRSQEVDLPTPEKKNDDITTGINGEKPEKNTGQTGLNPELDETKKTQEKNEKKQTGFDVNNTTEPARKDKRGDENERLERDDTTDPKTKDANWQQDKMNEANNQQGDNQEGSKQNVERASRMNDTRDDSILDRPKTETYEKTEGNNVGGKIKKENYTHTADEKRRDDNNRKNNTKTEKQY